MSFSLTALQSKLDKRLLPDSWVTENTTRGELVAIYRDYADGNHDADLTAEMKAMLRLSRKGTEFAANYCEMVVQTFVDRLHVEKIEGDNDAANQWVDKLLKDNRFDGFQNDVHVSTAEDGDHFVMLEYTEDKGIVFHIEPAWDGNDGMLAVYDRQGRELQAAIKVWYDTDDNGEDIARVNVYEPNKVRMFTGSADGGELTESPKETKWTFGKIPVVHFPNRSKRRSTHGYSELRSVVPLQDALNRTMVSMVMTSELSAFQMLEAKFFTPPTTLTPGMFIEIPPPTTGNDELDKILASNMGIKAIPQAQIVPFIDMINHLIDQIGYISRTPMPRQMGGSQESGEALKQREVGLLGKVEQFQVKIGNRWEDVIKLAAEMQAHFGSLDAGIVSSTWDCKWRPAELRNDTETIANIMSVKDVLGEKYTLQKLAPVLELDAKDIEAIENDQKESLQSRLNALPNVNSFGQSETQFEPDLTGQLEQPNGQTNGVLAPAA